MGVVEVSTTLAFKFPLGRYHANPWNRAVNEGASEWPPSPWRVLRALVATRYTRWPDLPSAVLDSLLDALADPPAYWTPPAVPGHTRHYMPDLQHRKGEPGHTDLTLDPFLSVPPKEELLVRWEAEIAAEQRDVLAKLVELVPYLGRSESTCTARLRDEELAVDERWWRPDADDADRRTRLLCVTRPLDRATLEATTGDIRRRRRTLPSGTRWVTYAAAEPERPESDLAGRRDKPVKALRFAVMGRAPINATHGILLADEAHRLAGHLLSGVPDSRRKEILGTNGLASNHGHAHWIPIPESWDPDAVVKHLVVWVGDGLRTEEVGALLNLRRMSGKRGGQDGYEVRGFPKVNLLFQAAGEIPQVAPELTEPASVWRSLTPYLPVRHRHKRESLDDYLAADVAAELHYRNLPVAKVTTIEGGSAQLDKWATRFRRYRINEKLGSSRPGLGLRLEFAEPVAGPILLGQLSHFGFGIFMPDDGGRQVRRHP